MSSPRPRKRKWDAAPQPLEAATQAAASVTSRITPSTETTREFEINDHPGRRFAMMSANLKSVEQRTGVVIVSKGRYYPPGTNPHAEATESERKLFLKLKGNDENSLSEAVRLLEGIMSQKRNEERVWCDMDPTLVPEFDVLGRLRGRGEYFEFIESECGGKVSLGGKVVGGEGNLHILVKGGDLVKGKALCLSLVKTVQGGYHDYLKVWGRGRGKSRWLQGGYADRAQNHAGLQQQQQRPDPHQPLPPPPPPPPPPPQV